MESKPDCNHQGSIRKDSVDANNVHDVVDLENACICKYRKNSNKNLENTTCTCKPQKEEDPQGSRNIRRRTLENRKLLVEMLLRSDRILQKVLKLREQSRQLLEDVSDDSTAEAS